MIQLRSILKPSDNTGAKRLRVIHLYGGSRRKLARIGDTVQAVVDQADPNGAVKDSEKVKVLVVRTRKEFRREDGSYIRFDDNAGVVIDKDGNMNSQGHPVIFGQTNVIYNAHVNGMMEKWNNGNANIYDVMGKRLNLTPAPSLPGKGHLSVFEPVRPEAFRGGYTGSDRGPVGF